MSDFIPHHGFPCVFYFGLERSELSHITGCSFPPRGIFGRQWLLTILRAFSRDRDLTFKARAESTRVGKKKSLGKTLKFRFALSKQTLGQMFVS